MASFAETGLLKTPPVANTPTLWTAVEHDAFCFPFVPAICYSPVTLLSFWTHAEHNRSRLYICVIADTLRYLGHFGQPLNRTILNPFSHGDAKAQRFLTIHQSPVTFWRFWTPLTLILDSP